MSLRTFRSQGRKRREEITCKWGKEGLVWEVDWGQWGIKTLRAV